MAINYQQVRFAGAYGTPSQLPPCVKPEVSFAGRSNVGKSSLMNKLFNRKGLVKVSAKPGKTTTINFFPTETVDFVDLPGYGFAKVSAQEHERWSKLMDAYFESERDHALVVCLIDIRHDASPLDVQMIALHQGGQGQPRQAATAGPHPLPSARGAGRHADPRVQRADRPGHRHAQEPHCRRHGPIGVGTGTAAAIRHTGHPWTRAFVSRQPHTLYNACETRCVRHV